MLSFFLCPLLGTMLTLLRPGLIVSHMPHSMVLSQLSQSIIRTYPTLYWFYLKLSKFPLWLNSQFSPIPSFFLFFFSYSLFLVKLVLWPHLDYQGHTILYSLDLLFKVWFQKLFTSLDLCQWFEQCRCLYFRISPCVANPQSWLISTVYFFISVFKCNHCSVSNSTEGFRVCLGVLVVVCLDVHSLTLPTCIYFNHSIKRTPNQQICGYNVHSGS